MTPTSAATLRTVTHHELTAEHLAGLRELFNAEYLDSHGEWDPAQPYGYAGHDVHVITLRGQQILGHVGWEQRTIEVGGAPVTVAGTGGVLVNPSVRGTGLGRRLMAHAADAMRREADISFGYLGCREDVVLFYRACGWERIRATERYTGRDGRETFQEPGPPLLVLPLRAGTTWPSGPVDLRGRCW
ncbi:GNAT family N-acetyltransferase [Kytococcus sedentarius]|nr:MULTISPECIES: GNAT family N-acetyltransferase [Kytococcus]ACV05213.1 acetyltransferase (GNAT) family protein [Kytococcus sedentarius DSM 20547]QQB63677.1 GNAT family N-acetyltransferase [Kytococcus sedentarius]